MTERYVIWSIEHQAWWKPAKRGYTLFVAEAGRYSREEALAILESANYPPGKFNECAIPLSCVES